MAALERGLPREPVAVTPPCSCPFQKARAVPGGQPARGSSLGLSVQTMAVASDHLEFDADRLGATLCDDILATEAGRPMTQLNARS